MTVEDKGPGRSFIRRERTPLSPDEQAQQQPDEPEEPSAQPKVVAPRPDRERVVVPRQERGTEQPSGLDIELREVRKGLKPGDRFLRVVPRQRLFTKEKSGHIEATRLASKPRGPIERVVAAIKNVVLGSPFATSRLAHERLSKVKALAIFSSDALSSSAYATEEILIILLLAGTAALHYSIPISLLIALLLVIVTLSYSQTIKAYPSGGGAYIVAHENLGRVPGLVAGSALLVDYILTVSVSVAAGVAAVTSAFPEVDDLTVPIGVVMIFLITLGNLRGLREAGTLFAIPTYFFILMMSTVIVVGFVKVFLGDAPGTVLEAAPTEETEAATQGVTLFLLMRAFSSGSAALTGIEAISNGVPTFKSPEVRNARITMAWMAGILAFLFLSVTYLSSRFGLVPEHGGETIVSQLGKATVGENAFYYAYQLATALILFLAANTSFNGFPPLGAILSRDRFLPRQFSFRGDRLAYSNGIIILAVAAAVLLAAFGGEVTRLIPLYALGVFVSFTLSQTGMVRHWLKTQDSGWKASLAINAVGAMATAIVAGVIGLTKFAAGAWISVLIMLCFMLMFTLIRRHYDWFSERTRVDEDELPVGVPRAIPLVGGGDPTAYIPPRDHVIVPVDGVNKISLGAIGMAREMSRMLTAVHLTDDPQRAEAFREEWSRAVPDVPLLVIESPFRAFVAPMLAYIESLERTEPQRITVILPSFVVSHWWERILHNRDVLRLRPHLKERESIRVIDFPYRIKEEAPKGQPPAPATA
jgi:amino acid transporter